MSESFVLAIARRLLPQEVRLRLRLIQRRRRDARSSTVFAQSRGNRAAYPCELCSYERPFIDYPGQELAALAKRHNQALLGAALDCVVIEPDETFSVWRLAPRPSRRNGYGEAAALRNGELKLEVGGAICLLSTVLYNVALLGGMQIIERHCHSIDTYGDGRYFELGRDAAIEYGYRDLRFRNPFDFAVLLVIDQRDDAVSAALLAPRPRPFDVSLEVSTPELRVMTDGSSCIRVRGLRRLRFDDGDAVTERLPDTLHRLTESTRYAALLDGRNAVQLR
jgi:vancomycin resistance protein VanW